MKKHKQNKKQQPEFIKKGSCQPNKCGAICCRMGHNARVISRSSYNSKKAYEDELRFNSYMGLQIIKRTKKEAFLVTPMACLKLKGNKCMVHKSKPDTCKGFPFHPTQSYYKICKEHGCTIGFKKNPKYKKPIKPKKNKECETNEST